MAIVQTDVPMTSALCQQTIRALAAAYPFFRVELLTTTAYGRPVLALVIGEGERRVLYTAAHHANEWITAPVLLETALSATTFTAYTPQYLPVAVQAPGHSCGEIVQVTIGEWDGNRAKATLV